MADFQSTLKSRTIFCYDNLPILRGINSNSVDLIYLDPPFNKGKEFHAPIGTTAEGASFHDIWSPDEVKDEWHNQINDRYPNLYKYLDAVGVIGSRSAKYYLIYMAVRIIEMYRILKNTGSVYLHCDPTASHYLKLLMDTIFGHNEFRNEIVWCYTGPSRADKNFPNKHDIILRYSKSDDWTFNREDIRVAYKAKMGIQRTVRQGSKIFKKIADVERMEELQEKGKVVEDYWTDCHIAPNSKHRTGYPTEKPLILLERIVRASSNKNDMVLDPFCGCATTCIAAEKLERNWIGIDISAKAYELVQQRLDNEVPVDLFRGTPIFRKDVPTRTDINYKVAPTKEDKQLLYGMQDGKCKGCKIKFDIRNLEVDHIIPRSQGGSHERDNLQLLCSSCNRQKGDRPMEYLTASIKNYRN